MTIIFFISLSFCLLSRPRQYCLGNIFRTACSVSLRPTVIINNVSISHLSSVELSCTSKMDHSGENISFPHNHNTNYGRHKFRLESFCLRQNPGNTIQLISVSTSPTVSLNSSFQWWCGLTHVAVYSLFPFLVSLGSLFCLRHLPTGTPKLDLILEASSRLFL